MLEMESMLAASPTDNYMKTMRVLCGIIESQITLLEEWNIITEITVKKYNL